MTSSCPFRPHPLSIELFTLAYTLFTTCLILLFWQEMTDPIRLLEGRALIVCGMGLLFLIYRKHPHFATLLLRYIFPISLLSYWYPDTYEFCQLFPNLDHIFATADQALFDCQPSIVFAQLLHSKFWSELFHLGYFSYYPLILLAVLTPLWTNRAVFERTAFVILATFFFYYFIFLFIPAAGPQYYFEAIGFDMVETGNFPPIGDYFRYHTQMADSPGPDGFFRNLVELTQASGERPTAAFPSSHVGVSTVLLFLLYRNKHWLFYCALPFYLILCCSTVYIQAHYLVDVIAGLITGIVFYFFCNWLWEKGPEYKNSLQDL